MSFQDPFAKNRFKSFLPQAPQNPTFPSSTQPNPTAPNIYNQPEMEEQDDAEDASKSGYFDEISRLTKAGPKMTAYQQMLSSAPSRADYKPGKLQRIAASLGGMSAGLRGGAGEGFAVGKGILDSPYNEALREHLQKTQMAGQGAQIEQKESHDKLAALSQARALGLKYDEFKQKQLEADRMDKIRQGQLTQGDRRIGASEEANRIRGQAAGWQHEYQGGQLKNADAANTIRARQAAVAENNQKTLDSYRRVMGEAATSQAASASKRANQDKTGKPTLPTQQAAAINNALGILQTDPRWKAYIKADKNNPGFYTLGQDDGTRAYQMFKDELKRHVAASVSTANPFPKDDDEDEDSSDSGFEEIGWGR